MSKHLYVVANSSENRRTNNLQKFDNMNGKTPLLEDFMDFDFDDMAYPDIFNFRRGV
jgi:hypothetical protein